MRRTKEGVAVITGASSGLGREAAYRFAERKWRVVLAARRENELEETARGCRARGGEALVVPTDVTRPDEVTRLAEAATAAWRDIDVWVNNAGVTVFARLEEGPLEDHRRVIETNLFGAIHGARAVVPIFRRQRRGTLINVGSVLSKIGHPFVPSYVISKFGLHGLSEALRVELAEYPDIDVCTIFPYAIDTPHFQAAADDLGREAHAMPPMQPPEKVAEALVDLVAHPRRQRFVPRSAELGLAIHRMLPRTSERLLYRALRSFHLGRDQPPTEGNLYRPDDEPGAVHGRRPPQIGTPLFVVWAAREVVRINLEAARHRLQLWHASRTTS
ncbi:SDR family oxidoreductase [Nannocystis sp. SCPEA4]|uniref:SDR family oxidoreductase n=1 Tax=Nannocystis sp. SCPEA4 TaxID=2996787 RepID=UPI0022711633|nr:SDR family oxidoreductase [Nannocystis sp. SCPEA4]MCY1059024.1 SDR family oxidoreductase [Nannocystis sp. SCPEA4]